MNVIKEKNARIELVVKKSRFIASVFYVENEDDVKIAIDKIKKEFYEARHNCFAYIIDNKKKSSDDGEPQGTAGKPILNLLENKNLTNCLIIVSRIFGGVLLGTGGLTHAYADSAKMVIDKCNLSELVNGDSFVVSCTYDLFSKVKSTILNFKKALIFNIEYGDLIAISFNIDNENIDDLKKKLADVSNGKVQYIDNKKVKYIIDLDDNI